MDDRPKSRKQLLRRFARETQAGPIVEFAIIVPVLLLLLLGIIDFGRAYFFQNNLVAAAREGARFAAVQELPCNAAIQTAIRQKVIDRLSATAFGGPTLANNATAIPITVAGPANCGAFNNDATDITVTIASYAYTPITPVFRLINRSGTVSLSATAVYRWERQ